MGPLEATVKICSAKDLKNVNWRHGDLKPYAVVWVDPTNKCSTRVDDYGDTSPVWDETLKIPVGDRPIDDATLCIDVVHAEAHDDTKPLIGSARLPLKEILDEVGIGEECARSLKLKRPSGRPQGKLEVKIELRELRYTPPGQYAPPYGQPTSRGYPAMEPPPPYAYGQPYAAAPPAGYPYSAPPPYGQAAYNAPPPYGQGAYGQPAYGQPPVYGQDPYAAGPAKKNSKFGMGTGLAVGAAAGLLGGLAIAEGADYVEDKIADEAAERVETDMGFDDGGYGGDDF